ncbi:MAG: hypothetical protein LBM60_01890 [Clostridium sp.]|jgi:hypothetical protein|nr:hypothetical protein [Clostridium sp.]
MEAYTKDFESHYKQEELFTDIAVGSFEAQYVRKTGLYYHGLSLPDTYENTLAMFREVLPAAKLSWEDLGIQAVNLSLGSVLNDQSLDTVRSWYGLNGREEMEKTMDALEAVWVDKTSQMDYETVQNIQPKYQLTVTDPALLEDLSQFLHVGYLDIRSGTKLTYLSVGTAYQDQDIAKSSVAQVDYYVDYSSTMQQLGYPVYVKLGELPPEWIERIMAGE